MKHKGKHGIVISKRRSIKAAKILGISVAAFLSIMYIIKQRNINKKTTRDNIDSMMKKFGKSKA